MPGHVGFAYTHCLSGLIQFLQLLVILVHERLYWSTFKFQAFLVDNIVWKSNVKKSSITNENATWFLPSFLPSSTLRIFCKWLTFPVESYNNSRNYKIWDVYSNGFCTSSSISSWQAAAWDLFISKTIESKCNSVPFSTLSCFWHILFTNVAWEIWMNCFWFSWWVGGIVFLLGILMCEGLVPYVFTGTKLNPSVELCFFHLCQVPSSFMCNNVVASLV